jgi:putative serine protease PepD
MERAVQLKIALVIVLTATLVGGIVGAFVGLGLDGSSGGSESRPASEVPARTARALSPERLYQDDARAVVVITSTQVQQVPATFFPPVTEHVAVLGSGFVIDKQGDVLTNDHVVQGGTHIRVGFSSGASYPAQVIGADASTDVAVVRVEASPSALDPLRFDNSSAIAVGDPVYAIGNPFGLDRTMTAGIVSATDRELRALGGLTIPNAIETDAPINHGTSGGPLLDRYGRVIGINTQIDSGSVGGNVGIGFAIPGDTARAVAGQLITNGRASHAWLGVEAVTIDPSLVGHGHGMPPGGAGIMRVLRGSPAAQAGLKAATSEATVDGDSVPVGGDTIVAVDGKSVSTSDQLADVLAAHRPGDHVQLTLVRGGKRRNVDVTLGNAPNAPS